VCLFVLSLVMMPLLGVSAFVWRCLFRASECVQNMSIFNEGCRGIQHVGTIGTVLQCYGKLSTVPYY
jgi:hypothetical protein